MSVCSDTDSCETLKRNIVRMLIAADDEPPSRPTFDVGQYTVTSTFIVSGYIRNSQRLLPRDQNAFFTIPSAIIWIVLTYYSPTFQLDIYRDSVSVDRILRNDGTRIIRDPNIHDTQPTAVEPDHFIFGCSVGWNWGVYEFSVKCVHPQNDVIGVVSDVAACKDEHWIAAYWLDATAYGLYGHGIVMENVARGQHPRILQDGLAKWKKDDVVTVKLDCEQWEISYFINGKQVGETHVIRENATYSPYFGSKHAAAEYQLIGMESVRITASNLKRRVQ